MCSVVKTGAQILRYRLDQTFEIEKIYLPTLASPGGARTKAEPQSPQSQPFCMPGTGAKITLEKTFS
jgi:hypothetical protein